MDLETRISRNLKRLDVIEEKLRGFKPPKLKLYRNFLKYVLENKDQSYYPITEIIKASGCETASEALDVTNYFSIQKEPILEVTFCYFDFDGSDIILDREVFIESLTQGITPVADETGMPIENFIPTRLGFYCELVRGEV